MAKKKAELTFKVISSYGEKGTGFYSCTELGSDGNHYTTIEHKDGTVTKIKEVKAKVPKKAPATSAGSYWTHEKHTPGTPESRQEVKQELDDQYGDRWR